MCIMQQLYTVIIIILFLNLLAKLLFTLCSFLNRFSHTRVDYSAVLSKRKYLSGGDVLALQAAAERPVEG